jgi:hypothetical protein
MLQSNSLLVLPNISWSFVRFFDCVIFTVGSMYFVSGSYPMTDKTIDDALADSEAPKEENKNVDAHSEALVDVFSPVLADS